MSAVLLGGTARSAERVPDLTGLAVADGRGRIVSFPDLLGEGPAIVHLWATWCGPCRDELPAVARCAAFLAERNRRDRLFVVSVDDLPFERVRNFYVNGLGLESLQSWQLVHGNAAMAFRLLGYPATVFLGDDRALERTIRGSAAWDDPGFREEIVQYLAAEQ
ncbi:thiol-disulfide isomerase/thioredoxin [Rhodopseudomonas julia]|uniref:Thiol-disulfide isomerase/thioredoxin n=1 Tax=Rhodopseudomonas julia TaxID=200617 RepID=A0ABU0C415_9BRAD|nr:TlpA disulfide reductase family protein [Rhodopseudomonas julia]MDQ0324681.1 thiol-disulfide isomerase/thioredoxin [Rhodopseudomonas julia]